MSFFKVLLSQIQAPFQALDLPHANWDLQVSSVNEFPREITEEFYDYTVRHSSQEMPHRLIIDGFDHKHQKWHLGINLENEKIEYANWSIILGQDCKTKPNPVKHQLPLLLTFPIWGSCNFLLKQSKNITGINHLKLLVLSKLKKQIDSKYIQIVERALSG